MEKLPEVFFNAFNKQKFLKNILYRRESQDPLWVHLLPPPRQKEIAPF